MILDHSLCTMISSIIEISLMAFFVLGALGLIAAASAGYRRGVYKSTYKLLGLALFLLLAVVTAKPLMDLVMNISLSRFVPAIDTNVAIGQREIYLHVNVGNVESTLTDLVTAFCKEIDATKYIENINQFAHSIVVNGISLAIFFVDIVLIVTIGNLFLELFWLIIFNKAAPKLAQRIGKVKIIGMVETMITYVVIFFLLLSPITSIANSINQGVRKSKVDNSDNADVREIINLVDIYDNSLFAKALFNWNTSLNSEGITLDKFFIDLFSEKANEGSVLSFTTEVGNLVTQICDVASHIDPNGVVGIDFCDEMVDDFMKIFTESDFITSTFEIALELAFDSNLLQSVLPNGQYFEKSDLTNWKYQGDLDNLERTAKDLFESGVLNDFIDPETKQFVAPENMIDYLDDLFTNRENKNKLDKIVDTFLDVDKFSLISCVLEQVFYWGMTNDPDMTVLKYLGGNIEGLSKDEAYSDENNKAILKDFMCDIDIGTEMYMLFDAAWGLAGVGDHVIKNAYNAFRSEEEVGEEVRKAAQDNLAATIKDETTATAFRDAITGYHHMNDDGTSKERNYGLGQHYAVMDSNIINKFVNKTPFMKNFLYNLDFLEKFDNDETAYAEAEARWQALIDDVYNPATIETTKPIKFFKTEIYDVLHVVTNIIQVEKPSTLSPHPAPLMAGKFNEGEEPTPEEPEEPEEPFEYKDYPTFAAAVANLFDGWVDKKDVLGSMLNLDSRIAPYLAKAIACLKPLDSSRIVYAIAIPFFGAKMGSVKDDVVDYFDMDISIRSLYNRHDVFTQLSDFLDADMITVFQHFYKGFMCNDEGKFDAAVLTDMINDDIAGFLDKLNSYLIITPDNPETPTNEEVLDDHNMKYYLASFIKGFYNFEVFNPHSGDDKNKNMQHLFDYIFSNMASYNIDSPQQDAYDKLDSVAKWEAEIDGICNLFAVIGENKMLNMQDYADNVNSTLLYSLAGDELTASIQADYSTDMPSNLGEVLRAVGDSVLFSTVMGSLLDQHLDGKLCDTSIGVQFANIQEPDYWKEEGSTMDDLLCTMAKLNLDLQDIDFTKITDVVGLNDMLHSLSNSYIFMYEDTNKFGEWLFNKVEKAMNSMSASGGLLDDPDATVWDSAWDADLATVINTDYPNNKIAFYDFTCRNGYTPYSYAENKAGWSDSTYKTKMAAFKADINYDSMPRSTIDDLYTDEAFMTDYYNDVLSCDELGKLVNVLSRGIKIMDNSGGGSIDFDNISSEDLRNLLTALNETDCLRICTYNAMQLAKNSIGQNDFVDCNLAKFEYLITAANDFTDYDLARPDRQTEIDHIVKFYEYYQQMQDISGNGLDKSTFFDKSKMMKMLGCDTNGEPATTGDYQTDILTNLLSELSFSRCFNLDVSEDVTATQLSFFESLISRLMDESGLMDLADSNTPEIETRIEKVSYDYQFLGATNPDGYNSEWVTLDGGGEIAGGEVVALTDVLKAVVGATKGNTIDAKTMTVTKTPASDVTKIMQTVNGSYLCTGIMRHFITAAFNGDLGVNNLLKYAPEDTDMIANFDLTYEDYGGVDNNCGPGTEIDIFQKLIDAMQYNPNSSDPDTFNFINLNDLARARNNKPDCFDGVFYFMYNSRVLHDLDPVNNPSNATTVRDGITITGRSVLMYNALGSGFNPYMVGTDKASKMAAAEELFASTIGIRDEQYLIEANGVGKLVDVAGNSISGIDVDSMRNDSSKKTMILNSIKYTYDRDDTPTDPSDDVVTKNRAYFVSEIVAGILDDVLDTEYGSISSKYSPTEIATFTDYEQFYFASKAGGGRANCAADITLSIFDNLNERELNGVDGAISLTEYFNNNAATDNKTVADIANNSFVKKIVENDLTIRNIFSDKLYYNGQDARMAKVLFISRAGITIRTETTVANDSSPTDSGLFVLLKYATKGGASLPSACTWTAANGYTEDYYNASFNFDVYGAKLMDYIVTCTQA